MMRKLLLLAVVLWPGIALAQHPNPVETLPSSSTTGGAAPSGTITVTNAFQKVFSATGPSVSLPQRKGCLIQNNGTNNMWIAEGTTAASASKTKSVVLAPAQSYNCGDGGTVLQGEVDITGTATDAFYAAQY